MSEHPKKTGKKPEEEQLIAKNPLAHANFFIEEMVEAGMVLKGTEIKSLRATSPNMRDSFVEVRRREGSLEAYVLNLHIGPYSHGNIWNHEATRPRKLLLHRNQINRIHGAITQDGRTCIPIRLYLKKGYAKLELGLGRGKKKGDKRDTQKERSANLEMDRAMKSNHRRRK